MARQYDKAERYNRRALDLNPQGVNTWGLRGSIHRQQGKLPEALAACEESVRWGGPDFSWCSGIIYAVMGRRKEALQVLAVLTGPDAKNPYEPGIALIYFALGDKEHGFQHLNKAAPQLQSWSPLDPAFDDVASDPRFQAIMKQMGYVK
jgi:tetratricopeptide (TPR) repeat protein